MRTRSPSPCSPNARGAVGPWCPGVSNCILYRVGVENAQGLVRRLRSTDDDMISTWELVLRLAVGGGMFLAAVSATLLALALLVLAKPLKVSMFPNRKEARRLKLVLEQGTPFADRRDEVEASEVALERIVVRPGSTEEEEDDAELAVGKGSRREELLTLMDELRRVSGVREVNSAVANGSVGSRPEQ